MGKNSFISKISFNDFLFFAILMFIIILGNDQILNSQILPQIRAGEWMIDNFKILNRDIFSYTMFNQEWINVNWLSQIFAGIMYKFFGLRGVVALYSIVIALSFSLIFQYLGKKKTNILTLLILFGFGIYVTMIQWMAIPFTFNFLFLPLYYIFLNNYYETEKKSFLIWVVVINILWTNINFEFVYGIIVFLLFVIGKILNQIFYDEYKESKTVFLSKIKILVIFFLITLFSTLLNPYGIALIINVVKGYTDFVVTRSLEWQTADFHYLGRDVAKFFLIVLFIIVFEKNNNPSKKMKFENLLLLIFWQFMFFFAQRHISLYVIFVIFIISDYFSFEKYKTVSEIPNSSLQKLLKMLIDKTMSLSNEFYSLSKHKLNIYFVITIIVIMFLFNNNLERKFPTTVPENIIEPVLFVKEKKLSENGIHTDMFGNLMIFYDRERKVFIDNRINFYDKKIMNDYGKIFDLKPKEWEETLKKYNTDWVLVNSGSKLDNILYSYKKKWKIVYRTGVASIYLTEEYYDKVKEKIQEIKRGEKRN